MAKKYQMHLDPVEDPQFNVKISKDESSKLAENRPSLPNGVKRVIPLCPLSKVFNPYVNLDRYLENPEDIEAEEPFSVVIQGSWCTKSYAYGQSSIISELEALNLVGIDNNRFEPSTGWTGVVYFDIPEDLLSAFSYLQKTGKTIDQEIEKQLKEHLDKAKELSRKRVIDYLRARYNDTINMRKIVNENGGKTTSPEDMEILISFILRNEIRKQKDKRARLRKEWEEANREILGSL